MIVFKSRVKSGFSLIDVIVALLMTSMAILAILGMQGTMIKSTVRTADEVRVTIALKDFFVDIDKQLLLGETPKAERTLEIPAGKLTYTRKPATAKSLEKIKHLYLEQVTAEWQELGKEQKKTMVRLVYSKSPEEAAGQTKK